MALPRQQTFDDLGAPLIDVPFCILDLETTGGSAASCEITEIGAVRYQGGALTGTFQTLVNPGAPIPPFITVLTGITQAMVVEAPRIDEALPTFLEFIGDAVIVGHNVRFDLSFLNAAAERLGYGRLPNRSVDTAGLARRLVRKDVRNLKLGTLAAHFRARTVPNHRALEDARATADVLWGLLEIAGTLGVTHLEDLLALPTARGSAHYGKIALTDGLPRKPGVYLFRDRNGEVFYVGKAKNLRTRVRSYFYGDTRRKIETMLRELDHIEHRVCATELEAEVAEVRLIIANRPRHNRRSRPGKAPHWIKLTDEAFPRLSVVRKPNGPGTLLFGPFRGAAAARPVVEALWDAVPVRRCTGRPGSREAACAPAQLGVAMCPCDGTLPEGDYAEVVERIVAGVSAEPDLLLGPLAQRIASLAATERFEEAAWVRDRHRALARSLERRRAWQTLQRAGTIHAAEDDGASAALIERGRLVAAWADGSHPPLLRISAPEPDPPPLPADLGDAEEAHLVWRWLTSGRVRLLEAGGVIAEPRRPVQALQSVAV
ncbi:MAG: DEDD exonuclease domain-containing protein [Actinobacteria bacterium]|nr:DEDD exonuclease domain-containing protein [Actinomycetota bacterium]